MGSVKQENDRVWIEHVPILAWGKGRDCTFIGALEAALSVTPENFSYTQMMGWSGMAFRTRWFVSEKHPHWCPSSPVAEFPEEIDALQKATGWTLHFEVGQEKEPHMEKYLPAIIASIDAGKPVLAYEPHLNMDVIFGYVGKGETLLLRDYFKGEEPLLLPPEQLGFLLMTLGEPGHPLSPLDALKQAMNLARHNWQSETPLPHPGKTNAPGVYFLGRKALSLWIEALGKVDQLSTEEKENLGFVSWWCFYSLVDAREAAVAFLEESLPLLGEGEKAALKKTADFYRKEVALLQSVQHEGTVFRMAENGKYSEGWTAEIRKKEQSILSQAIELEDQAIHSLPL